MPEPALSILLIEDNPSDALLLRDSLEQDPRCCCTIAIAERLAGGLELLAQRPFDIVLLDLDLPDSRGLATFEQLHRRAPDLPVVVFSGFADEHAAVTAVQAGAQDYIVKGPAIWGWVPRAVRYALERHQAQTALRASERRFRALIENSADVIALLDANGTILYESPSVTDVLGYQPEEMVGHNAFAFVHPDDLEISVERSLALFQQPYTKVTYQCRYQHRDGTWRWVEATGTNMLEEPGVQAIVINYRDVTERKEAERLLEERVRERTSELEAIKQRLELATRAAGMGIWDWEISTDRLVWDDQMFRLYGRSPDHFDGTSAIFRDSLHPDDLPKMGEQKAVLHDKAEYDDEFRVIWPDQSEHDIKAKAVILRDANGAIERMIGVNYDITAHKQAERLQRSSEEMLRRANSELERAMRMKDEFLASMSHELRTPLNGILGFSEALQEQIYGSLNERQLRALATIESSGRHLLALINDILDISKMEAGKLELQIEPCALADLCQASLLMIRGMAQRKAQSVGFTISPAQITIQADPRRLKQILVNLLSNAIKFTPDGGALGLDVRCDAQQQRVQLTVWDTGIGISSENLRKLFQPFVQLDSSLSRQHSGTGLGLSLVQRLAQLHGASIQVESAPGEGSRFTVTLPYQGGRTNV